jgi:hypothetical protein
MRPNLVGKIRQRIHVGRLLANARRDRGQKYRNYPQTPAFKSLHGGGVPIGVVRQYILGLARQNMLSKSVSGLRQWTT